MVHQALVNDEVDTYVEYTGTGLLAILNMSLPTGPPTAGAAATPVARLGLCSAGTGRPSPSEEMA